MISAFRLVAAFAALAAAASPQTRMLAFAGAHPTGRFGGAVAAAGDVDGDGFGDVLVGAPTAWVTGPFSGWAGLYSGRTGALLRSWSGTGDYQGFGSGMCPLGDVDGDRTPDFAIAGAGDRTRGLAAGRVWVISGATGRALHDLFGEGPGDLFGGGLGPAGDVDRDGVPDLIVGAPENGDPVPNYGPGYAKVFSGRTGALLHRWNGRSLMFEQGHAVDGAGDVDGDGHADLIVAAPLDDNLSGVGTVRVYSGRTGAVLHLLRGTSHTDHFGAAIAGIGDADGDRVPDVAVGAAEMGTLLPGNVTVFSGRTGAPIVRVNAGAFMEMLGVSLAAAGDVDGDGGADFAVGAPGAFEMRGAVQIHSGRDGRLLRTLVGSVAGTMFGFPVASAGDVNRDGAFELIVGARGQFDAAGAAFVFACADVVPIGAGCGQQAPVLGSTPLAIGDRATVSVRDGERHAGAHLFASLVPALPAAVGQRCTAYLHAPSVLALGSERLNGSGDARFRLRVPAAVELVGLEIALQASVQSPREPLALSNGVIARLLR